MEWNGKAHANMLAEMRSVNRSGKLHRDMLRPKPSNAHDRHSPVASAHKKTPVIVVTGVS